MKKSELKSLVRQYTLETLREVLSSVDFENLVSEAIKSKTTQEANKKKPIDNDLREMVAASRKIQKSLVPHDSKPTKIFNDSLLNQLAEDTINSGHKVVVDESKDENPEAGGISEDAMAKMGLFNRDYEKLI